MILYMVLRSESLTCVGDGSQSQSARTVGGIARTALAMGPSMPCIGDETMLGSACEATIAGGLDVFMNVDAATDGLRWDRLRYCGLGPTLVPALSGRAMAGKVP